MIKDWTIYNIESDKLQRIKQKRTETLSNPIGLVWVEYTEEDKTVWELGFCLIKEEEYAEKEKAQ